MEQNGSIDNSLINSRTNDILKQLVDISESVKILRAEYLNLQQIQSMSIVHLYQYKHDYEELLKMYNKIKNAIAHGIPEQQVSKPGLNNVQKEAEPVRSPTSVAPPKMQATDDIGNSLSIKQTEWSVSNNKPFYNKDHIRLKYSLTTNSVVCSVCYSRDGDKFVFCNSRTAFIIDTKDGSLISQIDIRIGPNAQDYNTRVVRISPDSKYLALGDDEYNVLIFDIETKKLAAVLKEHTKKVSSLVFTSDSLTLVSGGFDRLLCIWNMKDLSLTKKIEHNSKDNDSEEMIVSLAMYSDDSMIAVGFMNGTVGLYETAFNEPMTAFKAHEEHLLDLAISPFDTSIATGSHDKTAKVWSIRGIAKTKCTFSNHGDLVLTVCFSSTCPLLFTGSKDEIIRGFNYSKNELLFEISAHQNTLFEIAHHPTQNKFITCSGEGLVCVWEYDYEK